MTNSVASHWWTASKKFFESVYKLNVYTLWGLQNVEKKVYYFVTPASILSNDKNIL